MAMALGKFLIKLDSWVTSLLEPGTLFPWCLLCCWAYLTVQNDWLSAMLGAPILAAIFTLLISLTIFIAGLILITLGTVWSLAEQLLRSEPPK
ncbi:hypothetical protein CWB98_11680 [Pseudoalteromonas rubra]|uniref:Uncharacterized protein n=1 Tax=Pseudoalteromonas rubra TaxID=43658 RepID=A0A5S3X084_9GAMM|nr:hypothetical protein CWB98_11680 [Pseudoalteromonas rubra]